MSVLRSALHYSNPSMCLKVVTLVACEKLHRTTLIICSLWKQCTLVESMPFDLRVVGSTLALAATLAARAGALGKSFTYSCL